jgi:hypothetical protein
MSVIQVHATIRVSERLTAESLPVSETTVQSGHMSYLRMSTSEANARRSNMGEPIPDSLRERIKRMSAVREVTPQHVVLRSGEVLDPRDFGVETLKVRFVLKLKRCGCFFGWHEPGLHVLVDGNVRVFANGREEYDYQSSVRPCPYGSWIIEEVLR